MRDVIVLTDLRGVLGGMVAELLRKAYGAGAVREVPPDLPLSDAVGRARPRVLVTALAADADPASIPPVLARVLDEHPRLRILLVESDGRSASVWELRPARTHLGQLSPESLVEAIREGR